MGGMPGIGIGMTGVGAIIGAAAGASDFFLAMAGLLKKSLSYRVVYSMLVLVEVPLKTTTPRKIASEGLLVSVEA